MALKDITLGQYFPGNTLLHRLDPRTKLLGTVAYIVALFLAVPYWKARYLDRPASKGGANHA